MEFHQVTTSADFVKARPSVDMDFNPKIRGGKPPKWMVKIIENPIKMDDLGVPLFLEIPICVGYFLDA